MSIELYFLINQLIDFTFFAAVSRGLGRFRFPRVALASAIAAGYAILASLLPPFARAVPVQLCLLLPLSALICGGRSPCASAMTCLSLLSAASISGMAARLLHAGGGTGGRIAIAIWIGAAFALVQLRLRRTRLPVFPVRLKIVNNGRSARLFAMIDTGNRLTEPFTGQPVVIADAGRLRGVLPRAGFRPVAYGSVGGGGTLQCFRPDRVYISENGRVRRAPNAWIAVLPEPLPGGAQALVPAEFALL